jgi:hypothetical protein
MVRICLLDHRFGASPTGSLAWTSSVPTHSQFRTCHGAFPSFDFIGYRVRWRWWHIRKPLATYTTLKLPNRRYSGDSARRRNLQRGTNRFHQRLHCRLHDLLHHRRYDAHFFFPGVLRAFQPQLRDHRPGDRYGFRLQRQQRRLVQFQIQDRGRHLPYHHQRYCYSDKFHQTSSTRSHFPDPHSQLTRIFLPECAEVPNSPAFGSGRAVHPIQTYLP